MNRTLIAQRTAIAFIFLVASGCVPTLRQGEPREANKSVPDTYLTPPGTANGKQAPSILEYKELMPWNKLFTDSNLKGLIDTALENNQELNILLQEIDIAENEIMAREGEYLPRVGIGVGAGIEKVGEFTSQGANDANTEIRPGRLVPERLQNYTFGFNASWEVDIWKKLRNATKAARLRYLSTIEGQKFMVTKLVAEIANSYFELIALDNQLAVIERNIQIQKNALEIVILQKQAARATELAVQRFEAEVLMNQSRKFELRQQILETENLINLLVGRFPQPIVRDTRGFNDLPTTSVKVSIPSELLENRPDVRQAELELSAAKLDVKVARARFYPSLSVDAAVGYESFSTSYLLSTPASLLYGAAANLTMPFLNRKGIKAGYFSANAKQLQAVYDYERTLIKAYVEVVNRSSKISNLEQSYRLRTKQVRKLNDSIISSKILFQSARADYMEVLLTRRDALESQMELIETKKLQLNAMVNLYQSLGGGWRSQQAKAVAASNQRSQVATKTSSVQK